MHQEKRTRRADSGIVTRKSKRARLHGTLTDKIIPIILKSEHQFLQQLKNFSLTFLDTKNHSFEDAYFFQIEVPEARKLIKTHDHSSSASILFIIFNELIKQSEVTIVLLQKILTSHHKSNLRLFCEHVENNLSPLFQATFLAWEWALQGFDLWNKSEKHFKKRLIELSEKFCERSDIHINDLIVQLLSTFYEDIAKVSEVKEAKITKTKYLIRFFEFDSVLESIFSLPLVRSLNLAHVLKVFDTHVNTECSDYWCIPNAYQNLSQMISPLFKRVKEFNKLEKIANELPETLQPSVSFFFTTKKTQIWN